jgi:hypothetical protein
MRCLRLADGPDEVILLNAFVRFCRCRKRPLTSLRFTSTQLPSCTWRTRCQSFDLCSAKVGMWTAFIIQTVTSETFLNNKIMTQSNSLRCIDLAAPSSNLFFIWRKQLQSGRWWVMAKFKSSHVTVMTMRACTG